MILCLECVASKRNGSRIKHNLIKNVRSSKNELKYQLFFNNTNESLTAGGIPASQNTVCRLRSNISRNALQNENQENSFTTFFKKLYNDTTLDSLHHLQEERGRNFEILNNNSHFLIKKINLVVSEMFFPLMKHGAAIEKIRFKHFSGNYSGNWEIKCTYS